MIVVTASFPVSGLIFRYQLYSTNPFGAFPCVELRYHRTNRTSMIRFDRLAVMQVCHQYVCLKEVFQRQGGCPAIVIAVKNDVPRFCLNTGSFK